MSTGQDKELRVWDLATGACERVLTGHDEDVRGVSATVDGRMAATCSFDKSVRVWNLETGAEISRMDGHSDKVFGVSMAGNGGKVVSCSWDMSVRVWDVGTGEALGPPMQPPSGLAPAVIPPQQPGSRSMAALMLKGHEK